MIDLKIFTEGPDDVAALTELLIRHGKRRVRTDPPSNDQRSTATTRERMHQLAIYSEEPTGVKTGTIKIVAVVQENVLPARMATEIANLPIHDPGGPERRFALVYDPDAWTVEDFEAAVSEALAAKATDWAIQQSGSSWTLQREGESVLLRAIPWCIDGDVLDSLPDVQNLERVLCTVLGETYPSGVTTVAECIERFREQRKQLGIDRDLSWKAAIHLWCALVDDAATDSTAPKRFLGQVEAFTRAAEAVCRRNGVVPALHELLGFSR